MTLGSLVTLVAADRYTKLFMMAHPGAGASFSFSGVIETVQHRNFGIIANMPLPWIVTICLTIIVLGLVIAASYRAIRRNDTAESLALALIMAGAIGNLWDRLQWHYVFDWLLLFGRSAINLADICIGIGLLWYMIGRERPKTTGFIAE